MDQSTIDALSKESHDNPLHEELLRHVQRLVKMSRSAMSKYYDDWDLQERVYRGEVIPDVEDREREQEGNPTKMIVPNTYAQCMTFSSFLFLMFNQNRTFFGLNPTGNEDYGKKHMDSELLLERDLRKNEWNTKLFQFLIDTSRFGMGVLECCWTKQMTRAWVKPEPQVLMVNGVESVLELPEQWMEYTKYEGNLIRNVSPYRFFPDTRHALVDFKRGEFCAAEEEYSMAQLYDLQSAGEVAGVEHIGRMEGNVRDQLGGPLRSSVLKDDVVAKFDASSKSSIALVTKVQLWIVPSKFEYDGKTLGKEEFPVLYHLWYANNNRVIRFEPAYWWHNEFGWTVGQFTPDMHRTVTLGLGDLIYRLQEVISWFFNSRIRSVQRVIGNRLIVDPKVIDVKSLDGDGDIYLKKGMSVPLDRAVGQLRVQDVTASHVADADVLTKLIEMVTGVNGNAMGQYNSGRRSAQEARVVTAGAAGRMKMHGHLLWESALGRLGRLMHSNLRQSLSLDSFVRAVGGPPEELEMRFGQFRGTPEEVICGDDYFMFDSTLTSEKGFMAQSLQELLVAVMSNPMAAQQLDVSAKALLEEIQYLRGAGNVNRFSLSRRIQAGLEAPPMMMPPPVQ